MALVSGVKTAKDKLIKLEAAKQGNDYDIKEEDVDLFLKAFEVDDPGRYPPVAVRREARPTKSDVGGEVTSL